MSNLLGILHGLDFALTSWLVGSAVFHFFIASSGGSAAQALFPDFANLLRKLLLLTFLSSTLWMILSAADMAESWNPSDLWRAMTMTSFGHLGCIQIVMLGALFGVAPSGMKSRQRSLILVSALLLLPLLSVMSGHAGSQTDQTALRVITDWTHAIAVSIWSGGLGMLYIWLSRRLKEPSFNPELTLVVVRRFSHFAMASTAVIILTGILTSYLNGVSLLNPWSSNYGLLILGKVFFFAAALIAAAINQFKHLRAWSSENELDFTRAIRREVRLEFLLIIFVFTIAGFLARSMLPGQM